MKKLKIIILLLVSALYLSTAADQLGDWAGDSAHYILLGHALAQGRGYVDEMVPGNPAQTHYPFLFPLLLAPLIRVLGINFLALRIEVILIAIAAVLAWYYYFRTRMPESAGLALAALMAIHPFSVNFLCRILSETPYLLWSGLTFYFFSRWRTKPENKHLLLVLVFGVASFFTRTAAVALFAGLVISIIVRPSWRGRTLWRIPLWLVLGLGFGAAFGSWSLYVSAHPGFYPSYFEELFLTINGDVIGTSRVTLSAMAGRFFDNSVYYFYTIPINLLPFLQAQSLSALFAALFLWSIIIAGVIFSLGQGEETEVLYAGFTSLMILLWPEYMYFRFFYPLLPFFFLFGYRGAIGLTRMIAGRGPSQALLYAAAAAFSLTVMIDTGLLVKAQHTPNPYPPSPTTMFGYQVNKPVVDWSKTYYVINPLKNEAEFGEFLVLNQIAKEIVPEVKVIASFGWRDTALLTMRPSVSLPERSDPEQALKDLAFWKVSFLIVDRCQPSTIQYTWPLLRAYPEYFTMVVGEPGQIAPAIYRFDYHQERR